MKIIFVHSVMSRVRIWQRVADRLAGEGIELHLFDQLAGGAVDGIVARGSADLFIADLSRNLPGYEHIAGLAEKAEKRLGLGLEMPREFTDLPDRLAGEFKFYLERVSEENYLNGIRYLANRLGFEVAYRAPESVRTHGIYHPHAMTVFDDISSYLNWFLERRVWRLTGSKTARPGDGIPALSGAGKMVRPGVSEAVEVKNPSSSCCSVVAILFCYSRLVEGGVGEIDALAEELEKRGMVPLCVFCDGDAAGGGEPYPWMEYFRGEVRPGVLLNFLAGRLLHCPGDKAVLEELNVPIFQLIRNYFLSEAEWLEDPSGMNPFSMIYSLAQPEMAGVTESILAAVVKKEPGEMRKNGCREFLPVSERMETLCARVERYLRLRAFPNHEKRVTVVLHNNPCKGVEATVGMAVGMDTFNSLYKLLVSMEAAGYDTGTLPAGGREILGAIMERKAVSEFRWTTVDEIVNKGGMIHWMGEGEYHGWFSTLCPEVREKVNADWGVFPGEAMACFMEGAPGVVITGITFGKIRVMVQPKRGCYGAKCNGEVCRILHDPAISPPHHWLATYRYIEENSDAVIHFGAEGALEYLPGKKAALSGSCYPDISLSTIPNFYPYVMDLPGEGLMAKRRARAVIVDHLTPVYRPAEMDEKTLRLEALAGEYLGAASMAETGRMEQVRLRMMPLMTELKFTEEGAEIDDFQGAVLMLIRRIGIAKRALVPEGMHLLGTPPNRAKRAMMMAGMLSKSGDVPPMESILERLGDPRTSPGNLFDKASGLIRRILEAHGGRDGASDSEERPAAVAFLRQEDVGAANTGGGAEEESACVETESARAEVNSSCAWEKALDNEEGRKLIRWCLDMDQEICRCDREIGELLRALNGEFISPGPGGSPQQGQFDALPTGRNFYATDLTVLPTKTAWETGRVMGDKLILRYLEEEGAFPENVGISLWSSDAFKSGGEGLSQVLWLMGARPVWDSNGKVTGVETVSLEELTVLTEAETACPRPRIDVTIQTSGVMRDMVPRFIELVDMAVDKVSCLEEPLERNFILRNTLNKIRELKESVACGTSGERIRRLATFRVFSSEPGTYGLGVGLALDASAWEDRSDLAEAYVNWGGYAYGAEGGGMNGSVGNYGEEARELLAQRLATLDISYMKRGSAEYDILDCGGYAVFQGGMAASAGALGAKSPRLYWGDSLDPDNPDVRDFEEEIDAAARARLFNPRWIGNMKKHGFQGAQAVASRVNNLFKWSATSERVSKAMFDRVCELYIENTENLDWLRQENPYALEELTRRLLEAHSRGLWEADEKMLALVRMAALDVEGDMEESMGEVDGERIRLPVAWKFGDRCRVFLEYAGGNFETILQAPEKPSPERVAIVPLEHVKPCGGRKGGLPDTIVKFSPDGAYLAIGSYQGYLRVADVKTGRILYSRKVAEGMVKRIDWSYLDGRRLLYVGEQSPDGFIYCMEAMTGEVLWQYRLADDIGTSQARSGDDRFSIYSFPGVYALRVIQGGDLIAVGTHGRYSGDEYLYQCRVYRFDGKTGELRWRWPDGNPLPYGITWVGTSAAGRRVVLLSSTWLDGARDPVYPNGALYCIDGESGRDEWIYKVPPLEPY